MAQHYTHHGPGAVDLDTGAKPIRLTFNSDRSKRLQLALRDAGLGLYESRPLWALTDDEPNEVVLEVALRVLGDVKNAEEVLARVPRRLRSWWKALGELAKRWHGIDDSQGVYDYAAKAKELGPCEASFQLADGGSLRFRYDFTMGRNVTRTLMSLGYPSRQASMLKAIRGIYDETVMACLISAAASRDDKTRALVENLDAFMDANREQLWGWWNAACECIRNRYRDEPEAPTPGESAGAGASAKPSA